MSKQEFLETLRRALARELSESEVADNINYYWNYIEQQVASGKSEQEVLAELGDPRLIARTILQVDQRKAEEDAGYGYREAVYSEESEDGYGHPEDSFDNTFGDRSFSGSVHVRKMNIWDWLKIALVLIVICLVIGGIFHVLWVLLPFLAAAFAVIWIYRKITGR